MESSGGQEITARQESRVISKQMESSGDQEITARQNPRVPTLMQSRPEAL
jgi:hypothetical protein